MAHKTPHKQEPIETALIEKVLRLNIPGSLTQRINWLIREGIAAHPEIVENIDPALAEISETVKEMESK